MIFLTLFNNVYNIIIHQKFGEKKLTMYLLAYFFIAIVISAIVTYSVNFYYRKNKIFDIPNERSSHKVLTPRGGGLGIIIAFFVLLLFTGKFSYTFLPLLIIAALGFIDDLKNLPIKIRLPFQIIAAILIVLSGTQIEQIKIPFLGICKLGIFIIPISILWIVYMTNIYNFMDGIDGLAGGYGVIISFFMLYIAWDIKNTDIILITLILAGACIGFTFLNFPPAKIFMGDIGSTFLGFTFAYLSIKLSNNGTELLGFILLLGTFIFDTLITLARRIINGEKWFMSHKTHYYQRLIKIGYSHKAVTLSEYFFTLFLGIICIFFIQTHDQTKLILIIISLAALTGSAVYINYLEKNRHL